MIFIAAVDAVAGTLDLQNIIAGFGLACRDQRGGQIGISIQVEFVCDRSGQLFELCRYMGGQIGIGCGENGTVFIRSNELLTDQADIAASVVCGVDSINALKLLIQKELGESTLASAADRLSARISSSVRISTEPPLRMMAADSASCTAAR